MRIYQQKQPFYSALAQVYQRLPFPEDYQYRIPHLRKQAKERQGTRTDIQPISAGSLGQGTRTDIVPESAQSYSKTRDKIAEFVGFGHTKVSEALLKTFL
jgi:hypothetical protein